MFTDKFLKKFGRIIKTGNIFSFPYIWNVKHNRLEFSPRHNANLIIVHIFLILKANIILYQAVKFRLLGDDPTTFNFLLIICYIIAAVCFGEFMLIFNGNAIACLWNSLIMYGIKFTGKINWNKY